MCVRFLLGMMRSVIEYVCGCGVSIHSKYISAAFCMRQREGVKNHG